MDADITADIGSREIMMIAIEFRCHGCSFDVVRFKRSEQSGGLISTSPYRSIYVSTHGIAATVSHDFNWLLRGYCIRPWADRARAETLTWLAQN